MTSQTVGQEYAIGREMNEAVWCDEAVLRLKLEKTVGTLLALRKAIGQIEAPLEPEQAFAETIDWTLTLDADIFEAVFDDPQAYHFARTSFDLFLLAYRGVTPPSGTQQYIDELGLSGKEAFCEHLKQIGRFATSLAILAGETFEVAPVVLHTPSAIPATPFSLDSESELQLLGVEDGKLLKLLVNQRPVALPLADTTFSASGVTLSVAPTVHGICLNPPAFNVPGLREIRSVVPALVDEQRDYCETLEKTLSLIEAFAPATHGQIIGYMKVVAFKPPGFGGVFNTTCSRLPGASIFTGARQRFVLADDLIHEYFHNRLFALEERGDFFSSEKQDASIPDTFYSPWRDDPRPIYGLFHAVYVFERVLSFWIAAIKSGQLASLEESYGRYRASKLNKQLQIALAQLQCWATFSKYGQEIIQATSESLSQLSEWCHQLGLDGDVPAVLIDADGQFATDKFNGGAEMKTVEELRIHIETYDSNHRCRQIVENHFEQVSDYAVSIAELLNVQVRM